MDLLSLETSTAPHLKCDQSNLRLKEQEQEKEKEDRCGLGGLVCAGVRRYLVTRHTTYNTLTTRNRLQHIALSVRPGLAH